MMSSLALMMLVLVAGCYCAPRKITFGTNLNVETGFNATGGVNAVLGRENGAFFTDGELILAANATGKGKLTSYAGVDDKIVSKTIEGGGTIGFEARPGIHIVVGRDNDGNIPLQLLPRLPVNFIGNGGVHFTLASGDDARKEIRDMGSFILAATNKKETGTELGEYEPQLSVETTERNEFKLDNEPEFMVPTSATNTNEDISETTSEFAILE